MPRTLSRDEIVRKFRTLGFDGPVSGGKHQFMVSGPVKVRTRNPHRRGEIGSSLIREIVRQAGIAWETWEKA